MLPSVLKPTTSSTPAEEICSGGGGREGGEAEEGRQDSDRNVSLATGSQLHEVVLTQRVVSTELFETELDDCVFLCFMQSSLAPGSTCMVPGANLGIARLPFSLEKLLSLWLVSFPFCISLVLFSSPALRFVSRVAVESRSSRIS